MAEYIMKEQAELIVESALREYIRTGAVETAFEKLYSLPDANVAPVVYGEWLNGRTILENAVCSNCKTTYEAYYSEYQYCPRCGARMGGGESND